jgi:bacteriocin biosynthesis cyclodehydratase domain-containing protein
MGIRIDPTLELVWRDPQTVQLGSDPARAVVPVPDLGRERFLLALRTETTRDALPSVADQAGCSPLDAAAVLHAAGTAVLDMLPEPLARVELLGSGPIADAVGTFLVGEGVTVVRTVAGRGGPVPTPAPPPDLAVAVAAHVLDPAVRAAWSRRDVPHLPVVIGDGRVRIGPLVEPSTGPCLECVELDRADEDPAWAVVAPQVWGRTVAPLSPWRVADVAAEVVRVVLARLPSSVPVEPGRQLRVDRADGAVTVRTVPEHPACACRAPRGNDSARGRRPATSPAPTTSP